MEKFRTLDPCTLLSPVPAVMISCRGTAEGDKPNIITIAWAGTVNSDPPMVSERVTSAVSSTVISAQGRAVAVRAPPLSVVVLTASTTLFAVSLPPVWIR